MSARSGLVGKKTSRPHLGPSQAIFCVGRKNTKMSIFLGGPLLLSTLAGKESQPIGPKRLNRAHWPTKENSKKKIQVFIFSGPRKKLPGMALNGAGMLFFRLIQTLPTFWAVSYTHLRAHETKANLVCRLLLEKKNQKP